MSSELSVEVLKLWFEQHREDVYKDFFKFLSFPSISADPAFKGATRKTAEWLRDYLTEMGLESTLWESTGHPVVFASKLKAGPDRPTVLIYHHYDVQPTDPLELWDHDPFDPVVKEGKVYARGAVDNKGQCFYSLMAIKALLEILPTLNVNLKVFIEGEEECGGKGTGEILLQKKEELRADHLLVVDFGLSDPKIPAITIGMRGIITLELSCRNASTDLHSGVHGGIALNPNRILAQLLAKMWDREGRIAIPHLYEGIEPIAAEDLARVDMTFNRDEYSKTFGVKAFSEEEGVDVKVANGLRPSLEINGMWGGYTGAGFKTVIPAIASAKISCRLVAGQDPEKVGHAIIDYFKTQAPKGVEITSHLLHGAPAFCSSFDSLIVKTCCLAYEEIYGTPCQYLFCGASVPIVGELSRACGGEVALIGMGLDTDDIHAPNEHFGLDRFERGFLIMGRILSRLANE